jgi:hypothetical protein
MGAHISTPSPRPGVLLPMVGRVRLGHLLKLPNIISLCRIGMVPIFLVLLSKDRFTAALYVFVLAAHLGLGQREWYAMLYLTGSVLVVSGIHYLYQALVYLSQHVPELFS